MAPLPSTGCGRCGRAGATGDAVSLLGARDGAIAVPLHALLQSESRLAPDWMLRCVFLHCAVLCAARLLLLLPLVLTPLPSLRLLGATGDRTEFLSRQIGQHAQAKNLSQALAVFEMFNQEQLNPTVYTYAGRC